MHSSQNSLCVWLIYPCDYVWVIFLNTQAPGPHGLRGSSPMLYVGSMGASPTRYTWGGCRRCRGGRGLSESESGNAGDRREGGKHCQGKQEPRKERQVGAGEAGGGQRGRKERARKGRAKREDRAKKECRTREREKGGGSTGGSRSWRTSMERKIGSPRIMTFMSRNGCTHPWGACQFLAGILSVLQQAEPLRTCAFHEAAVEE